MSSEFLINQMVSYLEFSQFKHLKEEMLRRGELNLEQFIDLWVEIVEGINVDEEYLQNLSDLFDQVDYNMDGHVNWEEFSGNYVECTQTSFSKINSYHPVPKVVLTPQVVPQKMVYIPELRKIATCGKLEISGLWNSDGTNYGLVQNHRRDVQHILYIPQKSLFVSSSSDRTLNVYDNHFRQLYNIYAPSTQLCLIYDDFADVMYSGGAVGDPGSQYYGINVWDFEDRKNIDFFKARDQHRDFVMDMLLLEKLNILISCSLDKTIKLWDTRKSRLKSTKEEGHKQGITHISFSHEYKLLVSSGSERFAVLWNPLSPKPLHKLEGHRKPLIGSQTIRGTPEVVTVDISGMIMIWDIRNLKKTPIQVLKPLNYEYYKRSFKSFCFNEFTREIVVAGEEEMNYWSSIVTSHDQHISKRIIRIKHNKVFKQLLLMSPRTVFEWNVINGNHHKSIKILSNEETAITDFEIVLKMRHVLSVTNGGEIFMHNLVDGKCKNKMSLPSNEEIQAVHNIQEYMPVLKDQSREFVAIVCVKGKIHFLDVDNFVIISSFQVNNRIPRKNNYYFVSLDDDDEKKKKKKKKKNNNDKNRTFLTDDNDDEENNINRNLFQQKQQQQQHGMYALREEPVFITNSLYSEFYKLFVIVQSNLVTIYNLKGRKTHYMIKESVEISASAISDKYSCFVTTNEQGYIQVYSFPNLKLLSCVYIKPERFGPRFVQICEKIPKKKNKNKKLYNSEEEEEIESSVHGSEDGLIIVGQNETLLSLSLKPLLTKLKDEFGQKIKVDTTKQTYVYATRVTVQKCYMDKFLQYQKEKKKRERERIINEEEEDNNNNNLKTTETIIKEEINRKKKMKFRKERKDRIRSKLRAKHHIKPRFLNSLSKRSKYYTASSDTEFNLIENIGPNINIKMTSSSSSSSSSSIKDKNNKKKKEELESESEESSEEEEETTEVIMKKKLQNILNNEKEKEETRKTFYQQEKIETIRYKAYWSTPLLKTTDNNCPLFLEDRYGKIGDDGKSYFDDEEEENGKKIKSLSSNSSGLISSNGREEFSLLEWDVEEEERKSNQMKVSRIDKITNVLVVEDPGYVICGYTKDGVGFLNMYTLPGLTKAGEKPGKGKLWDWIEKKKKVKITKNVRELMIMKKKLKKKKKGKKKKRRRRRRK